MQTEAKDPLPIDVWSHVAITYDGARLRLYVNGELVDYSPIIASPPPVTEGELQLGAATELGDYFKGRIDEVRIYNRALTAQEITTDMRNPDPPVTEATVSYEGEEGSINTVTAAIIAAEEGAGDTEPEVLLSYAEFFPVGEEPTESHTDVGEEITGPPSELIRPGRCNSENKCIAGYRFNNCPPEGYGDPEAGSRGGAEFRKFARKVAKEAGEAAETRAKNGESIQCHNVKSAKESEAELEEFVIHKWAIVEFGDYHYIPNVHGEPGHISVTEKPHCKESGENKPTEKNCVAVPKSAPHSLDIVSDWRWRPGKFNGEAFGDDGVVCAKLDGHLTNNFEVQKGEEHIVHDGGENNPHFDYWIIPNPGHHAEVAKSCHFEDPQDFYQVRKNSIL